MKANNRKRPEEIDRLIKKSEDKKKAIETLIEKINKKSKQKSTN